LQAAQVQQQILQQQQQQQRRQQQQQALIQGAGVSQGDAGRQTRHAQQAGKDSSRSHGTTSPDMYCPDPRLFNSTTGWLPAAPYQLPDLPAGPKSDGILPLSLSHSGEHPAWPPTQPSAIPANLPHTPPPPTSDQQLVTPAGSVAAAVAAGRASIASSAALLGLQAVPMPAPGSTARGSGSYSGTTSMPDSATLYQNTYPAAPSAVQSSPSPVPPAPGAVHKVLPQQGQGAIGRLVGALKGVLPGAGVVVAHPASKRRTPVTTGWGVLPGSASTGP
jgi:hypothetical protein